jgi:hypothetical protein
MNTKRRSVIPNSLFGDPKSVSSNPSPDIGSSPVSGDGFRELQYKYRQKTPGRLTFDFSLPGSDISGKN